MTELARAVAKDSAALVTGAIAAQVIGGLVTQVSPLIISGLMQGLALTERDAGLIASVELLALAATAIAVVPILHRFGYRRVCLAAVLLAAIAQCASIFGASLAEVAAMRALAGIGAGALYATSLSVVAARCANPDRIYGYFQVVWALGSAVIFTVGGELTAAFAQRGVFALMAGTTVCLSPLILFLPDSRARRGDARPAAAAASGAISIAFGIMTLVSIGLCLIGGGAAYAFIGQLGERAGLATGTVGYVLTAATVCGLAGAAAATAINLKRGRMIPISGVFLGYMLVVTVLCVVHHPTAYVTAVIAYIMIYYFSLPYLFGLAAALDHSGRWAAAAGAAFLLGCAAGPLLAGSLIEEAGYPGFAAASVAVLLVAWLLAAAVCRRLGRSEPAR